MKASRHNQFQGFRVSELTQPIEGGAPTPPADITSVPAARRMLGWGGYGHAYTENPTYTTWRDTLGYSGYKTNMGGGSGQLLYGWGGTGGRSRFKYSGEVTDIVTAGANPTDSSYSYQAAFEGLAVSGINGNTTNIGLFKAKAAGIVSEAFIGIYFRPAEAAADLQVDWFNDALWSGTLIPGFANLAAGVQFLGGDGINFDCEASEKYEVLFAGHTLDEHKIKAEQRGFEVGTAFWTAHPTLKFGVYEWRMPGAVYNIKYQTPNPRVDRILDQFFYGMMRAMASLQADGLFMNWDAEFYKEGNPNLVLQGNEMALQSLLQRLPQTTSNWVIPRFGILPFSWASADANVSPTGEPAYANQLNAFRLYGMLGRRADYLYAGDGTPNAYTTGNPPQNGYTDSRTNPPGGHAPGMQAAASLVPHPSTAAPTLSASTSGTGSMRTITGTAAHQYGIHWVKAYVYPEGLPVYAQMTWNDGGGSAATNFNNAFMSYTLDLDLTGVPDNSYAIVQVQSIQGHQRSVVVALGPTGGTGMPDMIVTAVTMSPSAPVAGNQVMFTATVQNIGTAATPQGTICDVLFTVNDPINEGRTWSDNYTTSILPGASVQLTANGGVAANYWLASTGSYAVNATVNSNHRFPEATETNNVTIFNFVVGTGATAPSAPILLASAGNATVALSWTIPANGGSPITGYRLYRNGVLLTSPATTAYTDNAVVNGTTYSYRVSAVNAIGEGAQSTAQAVTPQSSTIPAIPPTIASGVPASNMIGSGGWQVGFGLSPAQWETFQSQGWGGFATIQDGRFGTPRGKNSSAQNELMGTGWATQRANEGWQEAQLNANPPGNQNAPNNGSGQRNVAVSDAAFRGYWAIALVQPDNWFDDAQAVALSNFWGEQAASARYLQMKGIYTDSEFDHWREDLLSHCPVGTTRAQAFAKVEQRGYECGLKIYTAYPACDFNFYSPVPSGTLWDRVYVGPTSVGGNGTGSTGNRDSSSAPNTPGKPGGVSPEMSWFLGIMKAGAEVGSTGHISWLDHHIGYRVDMFGLTNLDNGIRASWAGMLSRFSADLTPAQRDHWMSKIHYKIYHWADTDCTSGGGTSFYSQTMPDAATYNSWLLTFRRWSGQGERWEFVYGGTPTNPPAPCSRWGTTGSPGYFTGANYTNPYNAVPTRTTGMQAAASTTSHDTMTVVG